MALRVANLSMRQCQLRRVRRAHHRLRLAKLAQCLLGAELADVVDMLKTYRHKTVYISLLL